MFPFYIAAKVTEAGKSISTDNMKHIQSIHDTSGMLGAGCGGGVGAYESCRTIEAALPMNQSHDSLRGHVRKALMTAHGVANTYDEQGPWISDIFPQHVVYHHKGDTFKRKYTVEQGAAGTDPKITVGDAKKVHMAYVDSASDKESMRVLFNDPSDLQEDRTLYDALVAAGGVKENKPKEAVMITLPAGVDAVVRECGIFCGEAVDIKEAAKKAVEAGKPTTIPIKIIGPGWGSMAYYSKEMIQNSGPKTFKKGTQMFWNHATDTQEAERPEGDLNDLAAVLVKDGYWDEAGPKGPGLYSEAKVFSDYATQVEEKGPHIGVSINAGIKAHEGSAEGKNGRIADAFVHAFSTDFVTKAGAGGAPIVPVTESARGGAPDQITEQESVMDEAQEKALRDENVSLKSRLAVMESQQNRIVAIAKVGAILKEAGVSVKTSLLERVCESPKMTAEGNVDTEWAKGVAADLADVSEAGGRVTNLGEYRTREATGTDKAEEDNFKESLRTLNPGMSDAGLSYALKGGI